MCRDCGCEEGNARVYFDEHGAPVVDHAHHHHHGEHGHAHPHHHHHEHEHEHGPGHAHGPHDHEHGALVPPIHIHVHHHHHHAGAPPAATPARTAAPPASAPAAGRRVELETRVLARNDEAAARNRALLVRRGVAAVNLISSPGSGKTLLLERTLEALAGEIRCAVVVGDQQTDNDARRLVGRGAPVRQIETRSSCHLAAEQVGGLLEEVLEEGTRLLFVENVGNLVCPAAFDLGERNKVALLSVTEGDDKPAKYPVLFHDAPVVVITKIDLRPHVDWDRERCLAAIRALRPDARIFEVSARTGEGLDAWFGYLRSLVP
jgi:hydrogenase nickel incorporation protein HypB